MIQRRSFISSLVAAFGALLTGWRSKPMVGRFVAKPAYASKPVHADAGIAVFHIKQKVMGDARYSTVHITISGGGGGSGAVATTVSPLLSLNEIHRKSFGI